jgi:Family of unknown function (DUF6869)
LCRLTNRPDPHRPQISIGKNQRHGRWVTCAAVDHRHVANGEVKEDGSVRFDDLGTVHGWASLSDLAAAYWAYNRLRGRDREMDDQAAWACVGELMLDPSPRWADVLQALVDTAESENDLGMVGAHPIEELVRFNGHGDDVIAEIEVRAQRDERFRRAVAAMWLGDDLSANLLDRLRRLGCR